MKGICKHQVRNRHACFERYDECGLNGKACLGVEVGFENCDDYEEQEA